MKHSNGFVIHIYGKIYVSNAAWVLKRFYKPRLEVIHPGQGTVELLLSYVEEIDVLLDLVVHCRSPPLPALIGVLMMASVNVQCAT
jgi:hypothetical protein